MDYSSTGAMRSPFSPRVRQSIAGRRPGFSSAKKNQSKFMQSAGEQTGDVIYKTPMTTIETYGMPLPVMVTEVLTFASGDVTVRMSPCGWCWVVSGRRVLTWPRSPISSGTSSPAPAGPIAARELTLPQTDLAHKADLVVLFYEDGAQMPSCIGVSPEGVVRYWPSVGQEGVYVDVTCELAGQECERLGEYTNAGLVLATTTCTVVMLNPTVVEGRASVARRTLRAPSGWLGGLGRRVSLLFFGAVPPHAHHHADTKLVGVVVLSDGGLSEGSEGGCIALVANGGGVGVGVALQVWRGAELYEHNLRRPLIDAYARTFLTTHGDLNTLEVCALDARAGGGGGGLLLLVAACNPARSPELRYAIAHVSVEEPSNPVVTSLVSIRTFTHEADDTLRFLPLGHKAVLYSSKCIAVVSSTVSNDKIDVIEVSQGGDRVLGAAECGGVPLLFSAAHGVLALSTSDAHAHAHAPSTCESPLGSPCGDLYDGNLSLYEIDPHEMSAVTSDACGQVKTAFLFHLRRDTAACRALLDDLFPPPRDDHPAAGERDVDVDVDAVLDRTVMKIATEMLDDMPAGDPRWKQRGAGAGAGAGAGVGGGVALGSSCALQLAAQLRDKQRAFTLFLEFLRATGLWERLGLLSQEEGGGATSTAGALGALAEQLAAARALRREQRGPHAPLLDAAIYEVVCGARPEVEEEPEVLAALAAGALAPADVFYRRVSRAGAALRALARARPAAPAPAPARGDARAPAAHAAATLHLLTSVLSEVHKCRSQWPAPAPPPPLGPRALLPALVDLHKHALSECRRAGGEAALRATLLERGAALADLVLTAAQPLARSAYTCHLYERMRTDVIRLYLEEGETERAAVLAEKFKDFELLVEMCVRGQDMERLQAYVEKYAHEGMAEVAFAWLAERGGAERAALVRWGAATAGAGAGAAGVRLRAWLRTAAGARAPLLALQQLAAAQLGAAGATLADLAAEETQSVNRMTTMASLAKLCLVASDETQPSDTWRKVESRLSLGEQHVALPRDIRLHNGLDTEDMKVMSPEDIVQMYVDSESRSLTEYDYKKALDLTDFIQDMERRDDLRLRIWCACVLRDEWSSCLAGAPADAMHDKMFFRLIDLVHVMGGDLDLLLPPLEDILTARELAELVSDPKFHFIIKYGYECMHTSEQISIHE